MSLNDLFNLSFRILGWAWHILFQQAQEHPGVVAAGLYGVARALGVMIQSGQRGVLFRWGRVVKELEPGFHWLVPLVHKARKTPVRSVTMVLPEQKVMTVDGLVYDVRVNFVYRVENATKALTLVDHLDSACRAAIPIVVTEVLRRRDQAQLVNRVLLDRELTERIHAWVARWGLVIEQAGFTSIAPDKNVLHTTQLRPRTMERARALRLMIDSGLDPESALVMIGSERHPMAKTSRRYHPGTRRPGRTTGTLRKKQKSRVSAVVAKPAEASTPARPTAATTSSPTSPSGAALKPSRKLIRALFILSLLALLPLMILLLLMLSLKLSQKWVRTRRRAGSSGTGH